MYNLSFDSARPLDLIAVGRLCVDLNPNEIHRPMEESSTFTKYVGGSPANIAIAMARLGKSVGFIGKVSDDQHGRFITQYFTKDGINTDHIAIDHTGASTGLAFLEIKSPTDCSILMYRDNVADLQLEPGEVSEEYIASSKCLLISGTALAASPSREAVFTALTYAREHGCVVIFDLDYRPYTWKNPGEVATYYSLAAEKCDVIIGTREEFDMMEMLWKPGNTDDAVTTGRWFAHHAQIVVVKYGKEGSFAYTRDGEKVKGETFPGRVVKTFGAGDSYAGAFIYGLMEGLTLQESMRLGAASAAMVVSSHSCSDAMPTVDRIRRFIASCERGEPDYSEC